MAVRRSGAIDGTPEVEGSDDSFRGQIKHRLHQSLKITIRDRTGTERIDQNRHRLRNSDGIGELHFTPVGQSSGNDILGDKSCHVAGRAIDLGGILATESATSMAPHTAVGIHDDLSPRQAAIALRTTNDETPGRVDEVLGVVIAELSGDDRLNDVLLHEGSQLFVADIF